MNDEDDRSMCGISRCAFCGGTPTFRMRMSGSFAKCSVCGNGFEIFKSDFEKPRAMPADKRFEIIAMWNAKQDANERFLSSNDWVKTDGFLSSDINAEARAVNKSVKELITRITELSAGIGKLSDLSQSMGVKTTDTILNAIDNLSDYLMDNRQTVAAQEDPTQTTLDKFSNQMAVPTGYVLDDDQVEKFLGENGKEDVTIDESDLSELPLTPTVTESGKEIDLTDENIIDPESETKTVAGDKAEKSDLNEVFFEEGKKFAAIGTKPYSEPVIEEKAEVDPLPEGGVAEPSDESVVIAEDPEPAPENDEPGQESTDELPTESPIATCEPNQEPVAAQPEIPKEEPVKKANPLEGLTLDEVQMYLQDLLAQKKSN